MIYYLVRPEETIGMERMDWTHLPIKGLTVLGFSRSNICEQLARLVFDSLFASSWNSNQHETLSQHVLEIFKVCSVQRPPIKEPLEMLYKMKILKPNQDQLIQPKIEEPLIFILSK